MFNLISYDIQSRKRRSNLETHLRKRRDDSLNCTQKLEEKIQYDSGHKSACLFYQGVGNLDVRGTLVLVLPVYLSVKGPHLQTHVAIPTHLPTVINGINRPSWIYQRSNRHDFTLDYLPFLAAYSRKIQDIAFGLRCLYLLVSDFALPLCDMFIFDFIFNFH